MNDVFAFRFDSRYRLAALAVGVTPSNSRVIVGDEFDVLFGRWRLSTPLDNIKAVDVTGPYGFIKSAGPPHLSLADRGVTFATNGNSGLCVQFHEPVPGIEPTGRLRHPGVTVTVADVHALATRLQAVVRASA